ncbi:MAG TPA: histidine--tRNA ligase [Candidatus Paceibacterota bacterium]|nr:histidine--tRNA ligase [Candidatus Paceibacterota bacterium]
MPTKKTGEKKEVPTRLKGMRDIMGDEQHKYQGFYEKASEIALYYGFQPIDTPILEREEVFLESNSEDTDMVGKEMYTLKTKGGDKLALRPEGTAPVMRAYIEQGMQAMPQPVKLYYYGSYFRHDNPQRGRWREFKQFGMEMLGTSKSIADAMVIYLTMIVLRESGLTSAVVEINSIGDKECRPAYQKELVSYYRKHINQLCADCRQRMKTNPLRLLDCKKPQCQPFKEKAPQSIAYLCPSCKSHFKEVLEYLDALKITYRINANLVRGLDYYTRTVYEIFDGEEAAAAPEAEVAAAEAPAEGAEEEAEGEKKAKKEKEEKPEKAEKAEPPAPLAIASGGRYDYLAKRLGSKKDVPAVGGSIGVDRVLMSERYKASAPRVVKKPKVYFIQLGFEAKLRSLEIIEILRQARIPVAHALNKDSLSTQLAIAERLEIPLAIIFGQKEALEGTVIVRNMLTRSQETVKFDKLAEALKETPKKAK